jgi:hypothetical protein
MSKYIAGTKENILKIKFLFDLNIFPLFEETLGYENCCVCGNCYKNNSHMNANIAICLECFEIFDNKENRYKK